MTLSHLPCNGQESPPRCHAPRVCGGPLLRVRQVILDGWSRSVFGVSRGTSGFFCSLWHLRNHRFGPRQSSSGNPGLNVRRRTLLAKLMPEQDGRCRRNCERCCHYIQSFGIPPRSAFQPADYKRAGKSTEIADGVDHGDSGRRAGSG
jgi:hypothetical protein